MGLMRHQNRHVTTVFDLDSNWQVVTEWVGTLDEVDGVVFSAGILERAPIGFISAPILTKVMRINFEAPIGITQALVRQKKLRKDASVVYVSSLAGISATLLGLLTYSASKGAISTAVRILALELAPRRIRVNAVCPGMIRTELVSGDVSVTQEQLLQYELLKYPLGFGRPDQVGSVIAFLLGEGASWITGTNIILDGGASLK